MEIEKNTSIGLYADVIDSESSLKQFSNLLDHCFEVPNGMNYLSDFPVWDPGFAVTPVLRIGIFRDQKLIASTAVRIAQIKLKDQSILNAAVLGAVATLPEYRNRGLASTMVTMAVDWAKERDASIALLWSSRYEFYHRLGFDYFESQTNIPLKNIEFPSLPKSSKETPKIYVGWHSQLFKLIQSRSEGLVLEDRDRFWYGAHKNVQWYYVGTADRPLAYAACGRGIDLKDTIHEWGGNQESLMYLLNYLKKALPQAKLLCSSTQVQEFSQTWGWKVTSDLINPLCMAKKLSPFMQSIPSFWIWGLDAA